MIRSKKLIRENVLVEKIIKNMINLSKLNIPRLKAYRKSLIIKIAKFEACHCGWECCPDALEKIKDNPEYQKLKLERDRVNKELGERQRNDSTN